MVLQSTLRSVRSRISILASYIGDDDCRLTSPVPTLLQSNEPPSPSEVVLISKAIAEARTILAKIDSQIQSDSTSSALRKRRASIVAFIEAHGGIFAPIRRIPPELVGEILAWFIPDPEPTRFKPQSWKLLEVCHSWRELALSIPRMWSVVPMLRLNKRTESVKFTEFLVRYLERSCKCPLYILIYAPFREYTRHPVLDALMVHSERWESLQMDSTFVTIASLRRIRDKLPSLNSLTLDIWKYAPINRLDVFEIAPKLEHVKIAGIYPYEMLLPWARLTTYKEKVLNNSAMVHVLNSSPLLKRLDVTRNTDVVSFSPVTLSELAILRLRYDEVIPPDNAIDCLILPALLDVQIIGSPGELIPHLQSLVNRSLCLNLRRLAFRTNAMSPGDLTTLLKSTPLLSELDINHPPSYDAANLIFSPFKVPIVPRLEHLYIHSNGMWGDEEIYRDIARTRCEYVPEISRSRRHRIMPLKTLRFVFMRPDLCVVQQASLQGWFRPNSQHPVARQLSVFNSDLESQLPEINPKVRWSAGIATKRALDLTYSRRLNHLFSAIEKCVVEDVQHLHETRIHLTLRNIAMIRESHIPGDEKYHFRERASRIIQDWEALFYRDLDNFNWVLTGDRSLVYIRRHHKFRRGEQAVDRIIYGVKDNLDARDVYWDLFM